MSIIRSVTTRSSAQPNIEYRVGINSTRKVNQEDVSKDEWVQTPIVEVYHRSAEYEVLDGTEWKCIGRYTFDDFIELNRDVARIVRDLLPKTDDADEDTKDDGDGPSLS